MHVFPQVSFSGLFSPMSRTSFVKERIRIYKHMCGVRTMRDGWPFLWKMQCDNFEMADLLEFTRQ